MRISGSVACPGDEDWIHAHGDCCHQVGAIVRWEASQGPLDVGLFDEEGQPLPLNQPGDIVQHKPGEVRLLRARHGGTFLIRIRTSGAVAVPYSMEVLAPVFVR
jgi:hypothetical protein